MEKTKKFDSIKIAGLKDILCMKINAIIGRGSKKDFYDIYFILKKLKLSHKKCVDLFIKKFGAYNPFVIYKSMVFFDDAEKEPDLKLYKKIKWEIIKKFFIKKFGNINL